MKRIVPVIVIFSCFVLLSCQRQVGKKTLLQRSFYNETWERFDYVRNDIAIKAETTYDLSLHISFTDDYPYDYIDLIFTIFTSDGEPYRSKEYKPKVKDDKGQWSSELKDGCYTFTLPINKQLRLDTPGTYCFQIEQKMPITPLVGVKELTLINNE